MSSVIESGRMPPSDAQIVMALMGGDTAALGVAYDRYGTALHTYAYSMVRSRDRAADVTHDSFVVAAARIHQLRDPDRLRPWLYAIVRSECLRSLRGSKREVAFEDWHDAATYDEPDRDLRRRELRALVQEALGGLSPKDREIVELSLRHDLDNAAIAAVLGVKPSHVTALTSRARRSLERSLGTLLVARAVPVGCADLAEVLSAWDGEWTPLWRKRIGKHIDGCPVCVGERRRRFSPAAILAILPLLAVPVGLKVRTMSDAAPQLAAVIRPSPEVGGALNAHVGRPDLLNQAVAGKAAPAHPMNGANQAAAGKAAPAHPMNGADHAVAGKSAPTDPMNGANHAIAAKGAPPADPNHMNQAVVGRPSQSPDMSYGTNPATAAKTAPSPVTMGGSTPPDMSKPAPATKVDGVEAWTYPVADASKNRWVPYAGAAAVVMVAAVGAVVGFTMLGNDDPVPQPVVDGSTVVTQPVVVPPARSSDAPADTVTTSPGNPPGVTSPGESPRGVPPASGSQPIPAPVVPAPVSPPPSPPVSEPAVSAPDVPPAVGSGSQAPDPGPRQCQVCSLQVPAPVVPADPPPVLH